MKIRIKTHAELLQTGFCLTPAGNYVHAKVPDLRPEMIESAKLFSQELMRLLLAEREKYIDGCRYSGEHFVKEDALEGTVEPMPGLDLQRLVTPEMLDRQAQGR